MRRSVCVLFVLVVLPGFASAPAVAAPYSLGRAASAAPTIALDFDETTVTASGLTPGAEAVFFSVARLPRGTFSAVTKTLAFEAVDATGHALHVANDGGVPVRSVWVVVDRETGAAGIGAPERFRLEPGELPADALVGVSEGVPPGQLRRFRHTLGWVDLLVVRPAGGVWSLRAADGGVEDADGIADGTLTTTLDDLEPVGAGPLPPAAFLPGDTVVAIDPRSLRFYAVRVVGDPDPQGVRPVKGGGR